MEPLSSLATEASLSASYKSKAASVVMLLATEAFLHENTYLNKTII